MDKTKKSGAAVLIDYIIMAAAIISAVCFILYYGEFYRNGIIMWAGVCAFTMMYQLKLRLVLGDIMTSIENHINYKQFWFKEQPFEKALYRAFRVKKWKDNVPTYNPELFVISDHSLEDIANTMSKVELDHWNNELISLSTLLFAFVWGGFGAFVIAAVAAMIFDAQFICIQRYNRPRVVRLIERQNKFKKQREDA